MATKDGATRKKPLFPNANGAGGAKGPLRVRVGGGGGAKAVPATPAAPTKTPPFSFNMKKPAASNTKAPTLATGAKIPGASTSGASGTGAVRVPVFGKKPTGSTSTAARTTSTKAPFVLSVGAKALPGKVRAASVVTKQPRAVLPVGGTQVTKAGTVKPDSKTKGTDLGTKAPIKSVATSGKTGVPPDTFSRVKLPSNLSTAKMPGRGVSDAKKILPKKESRFQLKSTLTSKTTPTALGFADPLRVPTSAASVSGPLRVATPGPSVTGPLRVPILSTGVKNTDSASKKRVQDETSKNTTTPAKKPRVKNSGSAESKTTQAMNIVSPEPRASASSAALRALHADTVSGTESLKNDHAFSNGPAASHPGSFVTTEERDMANSTIENGVLEAESEHFLKRVRDLQLFVDDVAEQKHRICNDLLDSNALASELLLDIMTDITVLQAGLKLLDLDELSSKVQERIDADEAQYIDAFPLS